MNNRARKLIYISSALILLVAVLPIVYTLCVQTSSGDEILTATIYDTSQYNLGGEGLALTNAGVNITGWQYNTSKYLQVNSNIPSDGKTYKICVSLPKELYFVTKEFLAPAGFSKVDFTKNPNLTVNGSKSYGNATSGEACYTIMNGVTTATLQLEIGYDYVLWDKMANSLITEPTDKAIDVKLYTVESDTKNEMENLFVKEAYAGNAYAFYAYNYIRFDNKLPTSTILLTDDLKTKSQIEVGARATSQEGFYMYYEEIIYELALPRYTDKNGKAHYLKYDWDKIIFNDIIGASPDYEVDKSQIDTGIIKVIFHNYYSCTESQFKVNFTFSDTIDTTLATKFVFNAPNVSKVYIRNKKDEIVQLWETTIKPMTYTNEREEQVSLSHYGVAVSYTNKTNKSVNELGIFAIANSGTGDSNRKNILIEFDDENTNYIKVTTMRIPIDTLQQNVNITYSLVDENGNLIYFDESGNVVSSDTSGASVYRTINVKNTEYNNYTTVNRSIILSRTMLPENERNFYFKTISYSIESIPAGTALYNSSGQKAISAAGTFYGYVGDVSQSKSVYSRMTIKSEGFSNISTRAYAFLTSNATSPFNIENAKINGASSSISVTAGNSLNLSGSIKYIYYPYGNTLWFNNIVLGLLLPNGISVNEDSLNLTLGNNAKVNVDRVEVEELYNGLKMWKIYLDKEVVIGGYNENLASFNPTVNFSLQLNTEYYMNQQTVVLNTALYVASAETETMAAQINAASGAYQWAQKTDTYDLNGNGMTNDKIGGINPTNTTSFEIVPQSATFDIVDTASLDNGDNTNKINLLNPDSSISYKLILDCTNGGQASDFSYYIPIPKATSGTDSYMITTLDGLFNLSLQGAASISGHDLYDLYYTTSPGLSMNNVENADIIWLPASQVSNFNDVTMIKIVAKGSTIPNGSNTTISLNLKYSGSTFNEEAGSTFTYHSAGNYSYIVNGRETTGTFATPGITMRLNYAKELSPLTLTAAPNRNPEIEGNVNSVQTIEAELPIFINQQNLKITNVETSNVVLQTKSYLNSNLDMEGIYANETFGITVSLNNGSEVNVLSSASTTPINVGTTGNNRATILKYTIYNANNLTDNTTNRYVIITFTSDNGVTIKQKININRELAIASNPVSAIVAGSRSQLFNDTTTNVTISKNSSFTAQFVLDYIPDMYEEKSIVFDSPLPVGTVLTLYDYVGDNTPTYWYYKVTEATNKIQISKFKKMGYLNTGYIRLTGSNPTEQIYMVLVDFKYVDSNIADNYKVYLELESSTTNNVVSQELAVTLENNRTFNLSSNKNTIGFGDELTLTYSMVSSLGTESNYFGKKLAYVIKTSDNIPIDTYILANNEKYYMNKDNEFIIPLEDVLGDSKNITLSFNTSMDSNLSSFNFDINLMIGTTANANAPLAGEKVAAKTITLNNTNKISLPSFKITDISKRIISKDDLKNEQTITFDYVTAANMKTYVELQQKIGTGYQKVTAQLNSVNGTTTHNMGVFSVNATEGSNQMNFKLSNVTECGTYRLLFTIKDNKDNVIYEIPYAIIVRDNYPQH